MKICVTSTGSSLDSAVDPRFGRCGYFIMADPDTMEFECFENTAASESGGAGVQSARFVADHGAKAVLTGNVGPKAHSALSAAGIAIYTGVSNGTVKKALEEYRAGTLVPASEATASEHAGMR